MSEIFAAHIHSRGRARSHERHRPRDRFELLMRRILWAAIIILLLFSFGEMIFNFFVSPNVVIRKIEIKNDLGIPENELIALAGMNRNEYYFSVDCAGIEQRLETHPLIKEAFVEKRFPDTLAITLVGRTPLVVAYPEADGRSVPVVFDREGVLFAAGSGVEAENIPVLSGIKIERIRTGLSLSDTLTPFLHDLGELRQSHPELYDLISEIRIVMTGNGGYELVLYPLSYPIRVWIGKRINAGTLRYLLFALHFVREKGILEKIDEADFRTGELVYRMKGEE